MVHLPLDTQKCAICQTSVKMYTTYQSTYIIDDFIRGVINNPKIKEIQLVQQKIDTKQV